MRGLWKCGLCYLLAALMVLDPNLIQQWLARAQQPAKPAGNEVGGTKEAPSKLGSKAEDLAPLIKKLQALSDPKKLPERLDQLEKMAKQESAAAFDVKAKAKELGGDVGKIYSFVRDEVRYEAYQGNLRGSRGTLMALAGNSYDKSHLLADLLKEHGVGVRFMWGRLDSERAETLITQMFEAVKLKEKPAASKKDETTAVPKEIGEAADAFVNLNIARWLSSVETVGGALRRAKIGIADEPPVPKKVLLAEAADHLWVEVKQGETWTALDPSFKDAKPGKTYALNGVLARPISADHWVSIYLRLEERGPAGVKTRDVLGHGATAADLNGAAVSLRHDISSTKTDWTATPVLRVDGKEFRGQKITGSFGLAEGVTALGKGLFKRPEGKAIEQGMTAMWLDFEFIYPSGKKETVRREVFDRIGLVARNEKRESTAPLTPLPSIGMPYPLAGAFGLSFSSGTLHPGLARRKLALLVPSLRKAFATPSAPGQQLTDDEKQHVLTEQLNLMATSSHLSSQANIRAARMTGVWGNVHFYEATPRVCVVSAIPAGPAQGKPNAIGVCLDLRRNDLRPVGDGIPSAKVLWANITRGLLDGAMEHVLFVDSVPANAATSTPLSTIAVFERARQAGVEVASATEQKSLAGLIAPAEAKARLSAIRHDKVVFIMPTKAVTLSGADHLGWWQVNLESGETLGIMDTGLHQSASEWMLIVFGGMALILNTAVMIVAVVHILGESDRISAADAGGYNRRVQEESALRDNQNPLLPPR